MKNLIQIVLLAFLSSSFVHLSAQSTTIRVNALPTSTADFNDIQPAIDAANNGDVIIVEYAAVSIIDAFSTSQYGSFTLNKQLEIIGVGYLLEENFPNQYNHIVRLPIPLVTLQSGASGSRIQGLEIGGLEMDGVFGGLIQNCKIDNINSQSCFGSVIDKCFILNPLFSQTVTLSKDSNCVYTNNFIGTELEDGDNFGLLETECFQNVFNHNIFFNAILRADESQHRNNVYLNSQFQDFFDIGINNSVFSTSEGATPSNSQDLPNNQDFFFNNPTLSFNLTQDELFLPGDSPDNQWNPIPGSPIFETGDDGDNIGMVTMVNPYNISGLDGRPSISTFKIPECSENLIQIPVTFNSLISTAFTDGTFLEQAEYYIDTDPGQGNGISINIESGQPDAVTFFTIDANPDFISPIEVHILGVRVIGTDGKWSPNFEIPFKIDPRPDVPFNEGNEYFIGDDPGFDAGIFVPYIPEDEDPFASDLFFTLDVTNLDFGAHSVGFRAKDANGDYSTTLFRTIVKVEDQQEVPNLTAIEYFFDDEPGIGNGTFIQITDETTEFDDLVNFPLDMLDQEIHTIFIRFYSADGEVGTTYYHEFEIIPEGFDGACLDVDGDGFIGMSDFLFFLGVFGMDTGEGCAGGDYNEDGFVNNADMLIILSYFGQFL